MKYKIIDKDITTEEATDIVEELEKKAIENYMSSGDYEYIDWLNDTDKIKYCELQNLLEEIDYCDCGKHE